MKRSLWKAVRVAAVALFLLWPTGAWAEPDLGEKLIRSFFEDAKNHDEAAIEATLAQGFQSIHTNGVTDREGELDLIRTIKLGEHSLANFKSTRNGPVLVVTFSVSAPGEILGGKKVGEGVHERLAVWVEGDSGWKLIAYANVAPLKD